MSFTAGVRTVRRDQLVTQFIFFVMTLLMATSVHAGSLTVAWDAVPEEDVAGYMVYVRVAGGDTEAYDAGNTITYTFSSAAPGVTYYFSVGAYTADRTVGERSIEVAGALPSIPAAPKLLAPTGEVAGSMPTFSWTAVSGASAYLVWVNSADQPGGIQRSYSSAEAGCVSGSGTCSVPAAVPLAPGTLTWTVRAANISGESPWSAEATFSLAPPAAPSPAPLDPAATRLVPRERWTLQFVNSEDSGYSATSAFDGDPDTFWHTAWRTASPPPPHELQISLGDTYTVNGFRYLPRQDGMPNGRVAQYEFYVSADGVNWGAPVARGTLANTATEQEVRFTAKSGAYIRLRALSEVAGRPWSSVAELRLLTSTTTPPPTHQVPHDRWTLHYVDSEDSGVEYRATNAFDGDATTFWHTAWQTASPPAPHELQINLGDTYAVNGFRYLPRQDGMPNGRIARYEFYVSTDGVTWGTPVASGTLANAAIEQEVRFTAKSGRYVRLRALSEVGGRPWTSVAELKLLTPNSPPPPRQPIPQSDWRLHFVDSEDSAAGYGALNAFDGDSRTFWHTAWRTSSPPPPHELQIDLGRTRAVSGFRYLPRQDGSTNGRIARYEFYVSADGRSWGTPVATGTLANRTTIQEVRFTAKPGRYIRLRALTEVSNRPWTSVAELQVLE